MDEFLQTGSYQAELSGGEAITTLNIKRVMDSRKVWGKTNILMLDSLMDGEPDEHAAEELQRQLESPVDVLRHQRESTSKAA